MPQLIENSRLFYLGRVERSQLCSVEACHYSTQHECSLGGTFWELALNSPFLGVDIPVATLAQLQAPSILVLYFLLTAERAAYFYLSMPAGVGTTASALGDDGVLDIDTTISLETTWHAMEDLVSAGLVRSIGISNYDIFLTRDCLAYSKVKPAVNQIETHPYFQRDSLVKFCQKHGVCVTAHTPLGGSVANTEWFGSVSCLDDPILKGLAEKYKKTVAQVVLRWGIQRNVVVIPKTSKSERLQENIAVFDFELSEADMALIKGIDKECRTNQPAKFWGINLFA